jgi:hypothetical protein
MRHDHGPFDIVGDVHGCADELTALLDRLGYRVSDDGEAMLVTPPDGRKLVFLGDLVDRGPDTPNVLRIAMAAARSGAGYVVQGNHDRKLARYLAGRDVKVGHGLQASIDHLAAEPAEFKGEVRTFLDCLRSHYWLDGVIYGPEYDLPENLRRLCERGLSGKRTLALREFALGREALTRFVARAPLREVHEWPGQARP